MNSVQAAIFFMMNLYSSRGMHLLDQLLTCENQDRWDKLKVIRVVKMLFQSQGQGQLAKKIIVL